MLLSMGTYLRFRENSRTFVFMKNTPITYRLFQAKGTYGFKAQVAQLLFLYQPAGVPVRLVFFDNPSSNEEYWRRLALLQKKVETRFGHPVPVSYVAQPPCSDKVILEVHELIDVPARAKVTYEPNYCLVKSRAYKFLFISGVNKSEEIINIPTQAWYAFRQIEDILSTVGMPLSAIVRQWNYIERIGAFDARGSQNYQDFNNERSAFYGETEWERGYPAATGIGMQYGGVSIDADVLAGLETELTIHRLDNPLQVSAHAYSQQVLLGQSEKTTPKFERGKVVAFSNKNLIYISGTAAIRGEQSLAEMGIEEQTRATLMNIIALIGRENLRASGVEVPPDAISLQLLRVYLKREEDEACVRNILERAYPGLPVAYMVADICRPELLIEMEGIASF